MSERTELAVTVLVITLVLGAFVYWCSGRQETVPHRPGATRLVFEPVPQPAGMSNGAERSLRARAREIPDAGEVVVDREGDNRIVVEITGHVDTRSAIQLLTRRGTLDFYYLRNVISERNPAAAWEMLALETDSNGLVAYSFRNKATDKVIRGDTPEGRNHILTDVINAWDQAANPRGDKPLLTKDDLRVASTANLGHGEPTVTVRLNDKGARVFADFTRRHLDDIVAVVLNGRIVAAPTVREPIPDGQVTISGGFRSLDDAQGCAESLNACALPVELRVVKDK